MLNRENFISLGKAAYNACVTPNTSFSYEGTELNSSAIQETFTQELNEQFGTYALYRENKNTLFALVEQLYDDIVPKKVMQQYGQFAEIKFFGQGQKPVFIQKISASSKRRALQFITRVGLAGLYEVFKLDGKSFEVQTNAIGGAAQVGFEEMLDGRMNLAELFNIVLEGIDRAIYIEIESALKASVSQLTGANKVTRTDFNEKEMDRLVSIADSYGRAVIYCTFDFAATMIPSDGWTAMSNGMKEAMWNNGYLGNYKGHQVIVLDQSYEDDTNSVKVIDPSYAWIIPAGTDKPVKIAFEGQTIVRDRDNDDMSMEIQVYKKVGVGTIIQNNFCVYQNTSLKRAAYQG